MSGKNMVEPDLTNLQELKKWRYKQIDARTGELIKLGFVYSGKTFSLSENGQNNLLGTYSARDLLTYPFDWNVKDDSETYSIANATEMASFFMTALATKKGHQDTGTALKTQIRDAADIASVNAIVDNR